MIFKGPPWKRPLPGLGPRPLVAHSPRIPPAADAKVGQTLLEPVVTGTPAAAVGQALLEPVVTGTPTASVGQNLLEVLVYYSRYPGDAPSKPPFTRQDLFFEDDPITRFPRRFTPASALVSPIIPFARRLQLFQNYEEEWHPPRRSPIAPVVRTARKLLFTVV